MSVNFQDYTDSDQENKNVCQLQLSLSVNGILDFVLILKKTKIKRLYSAAVPGGCVVSVLLSPVFDLLTVSVKFPGGNCCNYFASPKPSV